MWIRLKDLYATHKWRLQLVAWAVAMTCIVLVMTRQCRHSDEDMAVPHAMSADSLLMVDLPECQRVDYKGFTVYFDSTVHLPRCAIYELTAAEARATGEREGTFVCDSTVAGCPQPTAYRGSGYCRGHMVPAGDLRWDSLAMNQSFCMTNVCPQDRALNEGGWKLLEQKVREWALRDGALIIATGPVIEQSLPRLAGGVAVPRLFYKVILAHRTRPVHAIAFVYPNTPAGGPLKRYATSVDRVERLTGIDFFSALPDPVEGQIESITDLDQFAKRRTPQQAPLSPP